MMRIFGNVHRGHLDNKHRFSIPSKFLFALLSAQPAIRSNGNCRRWRWCVSSCLAFGPPGTEKTVGIARHLGCLRGMENINDGSLQMSTLRHFSSSKKVKLIILYLEIPIPCNLCRLAPSCRGPGKIQWCEEDVVPGFSEWDFYIFKVFSVWTKPLGYGASTFVFVRVNVGKLSYPPKSIRHIQI